MGDIMTQRSHSLCFVAILLGALAWASLGHVGAQQPADHETEKNIGMEAARMVRILLLFLVGAGFLWLVFSYPQVFLDIINRVLHILGIVGSHFAEVVVVGGHQIAFYAAHSPALGRL